MYSKLAKLPFKNLLYNLKQRNPSRKQLIFERELGMGRTIDVSYTCWQINQKWGLSWRRANLSVQGLQSTNESQAFNILLITFNKMNE